MTTVSIRLPEDDPAAPHDAPPARDHEASFVRRLLVGGFGLVAYAMFFGTILYAIGFVGNVVVPKSIDSGTAGPLVPSLLVNASMLAAFAIQHTIMARPRFKKWLVRFFPASAERSLFVAIASGILMVTFWQWRPLPAVVWDVETPWLRTALQATSLAGWAIVFLASFMVSHFDLFGLRQSLTPLLGRVTRPIAFRVVGLYRLVRHPLMTGFLLAFWATPTMTVGHLLFAGLTTAYILLGIRIEERDLVAHFGDRYRQYRRAVPALFPSLGRRA